MICIFYFPGFNIRKNIILKKVRYCKRNIVKVCNFLDSKITINTWFIFSYTLFLQKLAKLRSKLAEQSCCRTRNMSNIHFGIFESFLSYYFQILSKLLSQKERALLLVCNKAGPFRTKNSSSRNLKEVELKLNLKKQIEQKS